MESLVADEQNIDAGEPVPFINLGAQYETIKGELQEAVMRVMESQQFVLGEEVAVFEKAVAKACDSRYAIGCASGTDALILSLQAADIGPGDEVITSPFTFFATAGAIHRVGATPVFVDIEPDGFNINPELVEAAITPRTKAIVPVHIFGQCAEMEPLWRLSVRHNLTLIEDACQAIGSQYRGRKAGVLGAMGCFSFFPTKNLGGAGDGGLITTDDKHLCDRLLRLRVHGDVGGYKHVTVGMNSRLDALQAAILGVKLPHLPSWTKGRQENAENYNELLEHHELCDLIQAPPTLEDRVHIYNQYTVRVTGGKRDEVLQKLRAAGMGCAIYYPIPLQMQECFQHLGYKPGDLPESERAAAEVLALPIFPELEFAQQERVVCELAKAMGRESARPTLSMPSILPFDQRYAA